MRLKFFYIAILLLGMGSFASSHECAGRHCKDKASPATAVREDGTAREFSLLSLALNVS